jgi:hypothetical protein
MEEKPAGANYPESRVLIIMTGGTICMQPSVDGLIPMTGFLESAMAPRPSFNDSSAPPGMSRRTALSGIGWQRLEDVDGRPDLFCLLTHP